MEKSHHKKVLAGLERLPPEQGLELVQELMSKAQGLLGRKPLENSAYEGWVLLAKNYLAQAFGIGSPNIFAVTEVGRLLMPERHLPQAVAWDRLYRRNLDAQISKLSALQELLRTEIRMSNGLSHPPPVQGNEVFLVHGHDDRSVHETARFLEKLGQKVTILREMPNGGRTIIEKFEQYSNVGFAVVLLTADDLGGPKALDSKEFQMRARQNVILELGYFLGRLGRSRVCALHVAGVEIPSDYSGVAFVRLDENGAWRFELARELKAAGIPVDMNNAV